MRAEQLTAPITYHGEGPVWSASWGGLRFVDMLAGDVLSLQADGSVERRHVGGVAACLRPRAGGGAVIGVERGFALEEPDGTLETPPELWSDTGIRMNEGGCDPDGRFYCGSMAYAKTPGAASMYRLEPDGSTVVVLEHLTISNGLEWSPDGSLAYYVDTATQRIDVFDYDGGAGLGNRRPFAEVDGADGRPDGLTVDAEGGVWVALNAGGRVRRYDPDGRADFEVEVTPRQVTACAFGGDDLGELFVTTSREGLGPGDDPLAGSLWHATVGVRGRLVREFAG